MTTIVIGVRCGPFVSENRFPEKAVHRDGATLAVFGIGGLDGDLIPVQIDRSPTELEELGPDTHPGVDPREHDRTKRPPDTR